ncbi:unnamed protein product [Linum tenue]|uniref:Uncharacterized protein n=1 Tax=Linum tenue TaxID=586396 RepID=A0AAV0MX72_9ROSI|nr:unnamed protein product [Linum tenue]
MPPSLFLFQDIDNGLKFSVGSNGARFSQHHPSLNISLLHTSKQQPYIVPSQGLIQNLLEHLNSSNSEIPSIFQTHKVNCLANLNRSSFNPASGHSATTCDGEHIFHSKQEWQFSLPLWDWNVLIHRIHQLIDFINPFVVPSLNGRIGHQSFQGQKGRTRDNWDIITRKFIRRQQLTNLQFDQLQQLLVIHLVLLVQEHHHVGNPDLLGEQDVLLGLGHGPVGAGADEDGPVHLRSAGDHVLDVIGVAGAVDVGVVAVLGLVLDGGGVDGDAAGSLLGCGVDLVVLLGRAVAHGGEGHG